MPIPSIWAASFSEYWRASLKPYSDATCSRSFEWLAMDSTASWVRGLTGLEVSSLRATPAAVGSLMTTFISVELLVCPQQGARPIQVDRNEQGLRRGEGMGGAARRFAGQLFNGRAGVDQPCNCDRIELAEPLTYLDLLMPKTKNPRPNLAAGVRLV